MNFSAVDHPVTCADPKVPGGAPFNMLGLKFTLGKIIIGELNYQLR